MALVLNQSEVFLNLRVINHTPVCTKYSGQDRMSFFALGLDNCFCWPIWTWNTRLCTMKIYAWNTAQLFLIDGNHETSKKINAGLHVVRQVGRGFQPPYPPPPPNLCWKVTQRKQWLVCAQNYEFVSLPVSCTICHVFISTWMSLEVSAAFGTMLSRWASSRWASFGSQTCSAFGSEDSTQRA